MKFHEFKSLIREDLYRYDGKLGLGSFFRACRYEAGFRFCFWMRLTKYLHSNRYTRFGVYHVSNLIYSMLCVKYGIHIQFQTSIGGGLYIPHALNIVVNSNCVIGQNCNISHGVTLGAANRGVRAGTPTIGDQVYVAPGAVIFGAITVGNNAAIGANCVVTKDIPAKGVVVGVPGKIISLSGSGGYVFNTIVTSNS